ncbi:HTH domain-containing protein [Porphyromonas loveana]|uniref:HTH domain-containing protein n=1 Tax=Porphyromonas loveana TaxID=1884669 RepID=UPI00359F5EB0
MTKQKKMTLHEAMILIIKEKGISPMSSTDIAQEVNKRKLYIKDDKTEVEPDQIKLRAMKYPQYFEINKERTPITVSLKK